MENPLLPRPAVIKDKIREAEQVYSLKLSLKDGRPFVFRPGQFTLLGIPGMGEAPFSFSSLPMDGGKSFLLTLHVTGNLTTACQRLEKGELVQLRGPLGKGWPLESIKGRHVVVVAGGVGIAPLRPVIDYLQKIRARSFVLYGVRRIADLLFMPELLNWRRTGSLSLLVSCQEGPGKEPLDIRQCLVTGLLDSIDIPLNGSVAFVCGPDKMMGAVARALARKGIKPGNIYVSLETKMECGIGHCGHCQVGPHFVCKDGPVLAFSEVVRALDTPL